MGPTDLGSMVEAIRRRPMLVRFFLMGLLNNVTYVIMIAGSPEIAAESIGLVYFLAVAPAIVVKVSSQFWFDKVSYWWRLMVCVPILMALAFSSVAFAPFEIKLLGVGACAVQSALGEASCLALTSRFPSSERRVLITAWSSGTGIAGIAGYVIVASFRALDMPFVAMLTSSLFVLPTAWMFLYSSVHGGFEDIHEAAVAHVSDAEETAAMVVGLPQPQYGGSVWNRLIRIVPYSLPLFVVYFAEYACQSGVWITIGRSEVARRRFYMGANIVCVSEVEISVRSLAYVLTRCTRSFIRYQIGVFLSRSSGSVVSLSVCQLPWLAAFQFGLMLFFIVVSALEISGWWLLVPAFVTGIFGGLCYVNAFKLLAHDSPPSEREKNMALTSTFDSLGVGCADLFGIMLQRWLS